MSLIENIAGANVNLLHVSRVWVNGPWKMPVGWRCAWQAEGLRVSTQPSGGGGVVKLRSLPKGDDFQWWTSTPVGIWPFAVHYNFRWVLHTEVQEQATWWVNFRIGGEWYNEKGTYSECTARRDEIANKINNLDLLKCKFNGD